MKTRIIATTATALALAIAPAAYAQDAAGAPEAADPAAPADSAAQQFSDTQISGFVNAMGEIQKIQADTALDAQTKQTQMASAIQAAGLDVETFNAIANQSQTDPALKQKIQEQLAAQQP